MIVGVAIKHLGKIYKLPKPNRHADLITHMLLDLKIKLPINYDDTNCGFYLEDGSYLSRKEAYDYAIMYGIVPEFDGVLYSEDLW